MVSVEQNIVGYFYVKHELKTISIDWVIAAMVY